MSDAKAIMEMIKENDITYVDLRFTDPRGKMQHVTQHIETIDEKSLAEGFMFDGSSIAGWKAINESDMTLMPDLYRCYVDPFFAQPTLALFCDVLEPSTGEAYSRDPRSTAKAALAHMEAAGLGDTAFFGPEAEFFIFEDVKIDVSMNRAMYAVDSVEGPYNSARDYEEGNLGHRPGVKGGYFPVPPIDSGQDIRGVLGLAVHVLLGRGLELGERLLGLARQLRVVGGALLGVGAQVGRKGRGDVHAIEGLGHEVALLQRARAAQALVELIELERLPRADGDGALLPRRRLRRRRAAPRGGRR